MRKIAVITGTRAEYGVLKNIIKKIDLDLELELQLIVTGTHLSHRYGYTINEILNDGFEISEKIDILMDSDSVCKTAKEVGLAIIEFSNVFKTLNPDIVLVLGDRYEIFAAATTAMMMNIPIAHVSGGEVTEGAMDEQIRHGITKMAHIHFPGAKEYADNISNMGEENWRIFNVGDPGIENIKLTKLMSKKELAEDLGVEVDDDTILVTYHPVTLESDNIKEQINNLICALEKLNKKIIITYPNSDNGGDIIIEAIKKFANRNSNVKLFNSLGSLRYLSVMKHCGVIVGNSSSALIEAPFLKKPVVDIGNRQRGRLKAKNIIQSTNEIDSIYESIVKASTSEFKQFAKTVESLYGEGNTSEEIVNILKYIDINENLLKKKLVWT